MPETIGVALIASNAGKTIRECVESFQEDVDQVVVVVNNSQDATEEIVRSMKGVEVHNFKWVDDFSIARNFSFSKLKTDWYLWVDADDTIYQPENLRNIITMVQPEVGGIWFPYHYAIDEFGNPYTIYERERLLRAKVGWVWRSRIHETVSPLTPCQYIRTDQVIIKHNHLTGTQRSERNFKLLYMMLKESPTDKRIWLYLGHQHFATQQWAKSAEWYLKFGSDEGTVPLERYQALCYCSKAFRELRDKQSIDVALMAIELYPSYRDGYLELAHSYLRLGEYEKAIHFALLSDNKDLIHEPPSVIFINPLSYTFDKYALLSEAYVKLNNLQEGIKWANEAYKIRPTIDVQNNIAMLESIILKNRVSDSIKTLAVHLLNNRELVKLKHLGESAPYWFRDTPEYPQLMAGINQYTQKLEDKPQIVETKDGVTISVGNVLNIEPLLDELEKKYNKITLISSTSQPDMINVLSQYDIEKLVISREGRHIKNLRVEPTRIICEYDKTPPAGLLIRMFIGQGFENWTPQTIDEVGCGGSETWAAMTARELSKLGHQLVVYAMDNQIWDGVLYRTHNKFVPNANPCNIFITSRIPEVIYNEIPAEQKWLWIHDIHCWDRLSPEVAKELNAIVVLSHWHADFIKRTYPFLKDAEVWDFDDQDKTYEDNTEGPKYFEGAICNRLPKIAIIGDATDVKKFEYINREKVPNRFIWCSSPDRGLEQVLEMWGKLKEKLPDATLKIFYGWEYFDTSLWLPAQRELKEKLKVLITQDGVEWCGRVGQYQLAQELGKAQCMLYPPPHDFRETYGIAFLEAQAAGVIVFYRQNGALGETIGNRGIPLANNLSQEEIVSTIVGTLANKELCGKIYKEAREYGMQRDWAKQAEKIIKLYERLK